MTSSNTAKVLSHEDIDELNRQVVERPVTIFQNLNAPAPCEEDVAEPKPLNNIKYDCEYYFNTIGDIIYGIIVVFSGLLSLAVGYATFALFWPGILAQSFIIMCCYCFCGAEINDIPITCHCLAFTIVGIPGLIAIIGFIIYLGPYWYMYFAAVGIFLLLYVLCMTSICNALEF